MCKKYYELRAKKMMVVCSSVYFPIDLKLWLSFEKQNVFLLHQSRWKKPVPVIEWCPHMDWYLSLLTFFHILNIILENLKPLQRLIVSLASCFKTKTQNSHMKVHLKCHNDMWSQGFPFYNAAYISFSTELCCFFFHRLCAVKIIYSFPFYGLKRIFALIFILSNFSYIKML